MERKEIRNAFELLEPTEEQLERVWARLERDASADQKIEVTEGKKKRQRKPQTWRHVAAAAVAILVIFSSGIGINAATGGELVNTIKEWIGIKQSPQDVIGQATALQERGIEVWAPEIYSLDEEYLIFGTLRGLVICDTQTGELLGSVDTQAIGGIYFNSDTKMTHVVKAEDWLVVFNSENGKPYGSYYQYQLPVSGNMFVEDQDTEQLQKYYALWEAEQEIYTDTFQAFCEREEFAALLEQKKEISVMYGRRSLTWTDAAGVEQQSFLVIKDGAYYLSGYESESGAYWERPLAFSAENAEQMLAEDIPQQDMEETAEEVLAEEMADGTVILPEFVYTGEDLALKAITEHCKEEYLQYRDRGELCIPGYVIYEQIQEGDELLVFGNFWSYSYQLNGQILEVSGGGEMPACYHLKETEGGYEVVQVDRTGDGAEYAEGIKEFTKNYPGLFEKYQNDGDTRKAAMKEYVGMYVLANNLDIQYIKEFGWDPFPIFE